MNNLNIYFVEYFTHDKKKRIFISHAGHILSESEEKIREDLERIHACNNLYGNMCLKEDCPFYSLTCDSACENHIDIGIRSIRKIEAREGLIIYGERWREIG